MASSNSVRAQGFTTGSNVQGYTLDSVELYLDNVPATGATEALVTLHAHDTGAPGELVATFANPEAPLAGANTFAAPDDAVLAAETTYFLVVNLEAVTRYAFGLADPPEEDAQPSSGWSVAELSSSLADDGIWSADESHTLRFTLHGVLNDTPPSTLLPWLTLGGIALLEALKGRDPAPSAPTAPGQVTGVTAMSAVESLAVSWTAVGEAGGYKVQWKSGDEAFEGGGNRERIIGADNTTAYTIPALTAGTEYTVRVIATRTGAEDGMPSAGVTGTPRALSANAALSALRVTDADGMAIALTPLFASAQTDYSASVSNAVARITVVPTPTDTNARVEFLDANDMALEDADGGVADFQADLPVGANTVKVKVTAENGVAMTTHTLSIRRAPAAPGQVTGVTAMSAVESLAVSWTAVGEAGGYKVQWKSGDEAFEGGGNRERIIGAGSTTAYTIPALTAGTEYTVRVIATRTGAEDGMPSAEVTGTPRALSANAALSGLRVTDADGMAIALTPLFASAQTDYSASVSNAVARITVVPTSTDTNARVEFLDANDMALEDADGGVADFQADLAVGANTVKVKVTAENGVAMTTHTLSIRRAPAAPGQVTGVTAMSAVESLAVSWTAVSEAGGYKVQWKSGDEAFEGGGAREHVIGAGSTTAYTIPALTAGTEYTVRVIATRTGAEDGMPSAEVTGTPRALSANAALSGLRVTDADGMAIALTPLFASAQTDYSASVSNAVARITVVPTSTDTNARVEFLDANDMALEDADGGVADFQADLAVGANTVKVKVTAENGVAMTTHTLSIRRAPAAPGQVTGVTAMSAVESLAVSWTAVSEAGGYKVQWKSGDEAFEGGGAREHVIGAGSTTAYTIPALTAGTEYTVRVIATRTGAEDGMPSAEVTGTPRALSANAALSGLRVTDADGMAIALTPLFASAQTDYSASVSNAVARITVVPTPTDTNARVEFLDVNDMALEDADGGVADFQADLAVGANTVKVKVTAENGVAMTTYTLSIRRAPAAPGQVMTIRVLPGPEALIVLWDEVNDADGYKVQWKSGKEAFESAGDREGLVSDGGKTIHTILYLVAGTEYTVRVVATRTRADDGPPSNEARGTPYKGDEDDRQRSDDGGSASTGALTDLEVTDPNSMEVTLNPSFATSRRSYTASVANTVAWVTFKPIAGDPDATVRYEDAANQQLTDADGNRSDFQVNLEQDANTVRLRVTPSGATTPQTYTVIVTRGTANVVENNNPPIYSTNTATRGFRENVGDERSSGEDVGAPVTADDTDNDTLNYTLEGPDEALFEIGSLNGQIRTRSGTNYDRESDSSHAVTVRASDGRGGSDTIAVTINVADVEELPLTPDAPTVSAVSGSTTSVSVTWTPPNNTGRPRIASYDLQYKKNTETDQDWKDGPQNRTGTSATISSLDADTDYDVQVRATNADGDGPWSGTGTGKTARPGNRAPDFGATSATREFREDVGDGVSSGEDVGAPVTATDLDNDSVMYTLEGSDAASFEIIPTSGQIRTLSGTNYDREADSSYSVRVKATDTEGGTDTITVTINVIDVEEKPLEPAAPTVASVSGSTTSVSVTWTPPDNTGRPRIASYDLQYKKSTESEQDWQDGPQNRTGTSATISSLDAATDYDVQVRATNVDGDGPWSGTGSGSTNTPGNSSPDFGSSNTTRSFDESVGDTRSIRDVGDPVTASDGNNDQLTYTLEGQDADDFAIGSSDGQIRTRTDRYYDRETRTIYSVTVKADDGNNGSDTVQVAITVSNVVEKPNAPDAPGVERVEGNTRVLYVTWTAPSNTGRPPILHYDLQYREGNSGPWFDGPQDQTGMSATIMDLSPGTSYRVQVRATNADGDSLWSQSGSSLTSQPLPATCASSENENIRLADGYTPKEGRVEVCLEDPDNSGSYVWGSICDDYWTDEDADVICKTQGYYNSELIGGRFLRSYFGGRLPILLDDLLCVGNESNILDCPVAGGGIARNSIGDHNCKVTESVGVRCLTEAEYRQHVEEIPVDDTNQSAMLSVADTRVQEAAGAVLVFHVTLSGTPQGTVSVGYATHDGTAFAGEDFEATSGTLAFSLGETSETVRVRVLDDLFDESEQHGERMTLRLSNAVGAQILDGVAYGYIDNSDPLPEAWLARLGRTAADHAVEAITSRLMESSRSKSHFTVGGRQLDQLRAVNPAPGMSGTSPVAGMLWSEAYGVPGGLTGAAHRPGAKPFASGLPGPDPPGAAYPYTGQSLHGVGGVDSGYGTAHGYDLGALNAHHLLSGSSFRWALGADDETADETAAADWTLWGQGAATRFSGVDGILSLNGNVATATVGVDREGERWLTGVAVAFSEGEGSFAAAGPPADGSGGGTPASNVPGSNAPGSSAPGGGTSGGALATTLTSVYPYARYSVNDRLSVWSVLGYGQGDLQLTEARNGTRIDADIGLLMGALGARGVILDAGGYEVALRADAMRVRMDSEAVPGLASASADTGRIRAVLEGSRSFDLGSGRSLEPSLELGLRQDSGDAETGRGIELGGGIRYSDAARGLTVEAHARGLVAHEDQAYREWGAWATIRLDPGESGRGLSLALSPTWGAAASGVEQVWGGTNTAGLARTGPFHAAGRFRAEVGYGVDAFRGQGLGTYYSGFERAGGNGKSLRLGKRWELGARLRMSVQGERHEFALETPHHAISVQLSMFW